MIAVMVFCSALGQNSTEQPSGIQRKLHVVGTAHLDTQWRWTIQQTINEFVPSTFRDNFRLMDIYPDYVFSFEGAFRYMLLREYFPDQYAKLSKYVSSGQWRVAGSWVDAVDVNLPSFESLVRNCLYGNGFFKQEFGQTSRDIFLPDCFGFGYALPSIAAHCGLNSFSTQKLSWGSAYGVPFDIGVWQGVDGSSIVAGLNSSDYTGKIRTDLSRDSAWTARADSLGQRSGSYVAYRYFGTGDTGGSPDSLSVDWLSKSIHSDGPMQIISSPSDTLADMFTADKLAKLPHYRGELLMTRHGAGCYTSQAAMKRWNRKNELLADATERASVIASVVAGYEYPTETLRDTWVRFLWHQFHDDLTGTSIPEAYEFSWNDEILCQNRFASMLEDAVGATTAMLDTRTEGVPIVVFNPLSIDRTDVVEATVDFDVGKDSFTYIRVAGPSGPEVPSQIPPASQQSSTTLFRYPRHRDKPIGEDYVHSKSGKVKVTFVATVPATGYAVFDVRSGFRPTDKVSELSVTPRLLENTRYKVTLDDNGDVVSIFDEEVGRELLSGPIQFQLLFDKPKQWPAWEIMYDDIMAKPQAVLGAPSSIKVVENGPARAAIEIIRSHGHSKFRTRISLSNGDGPVEFKNTIDWYEKETLLKVAFPFASANDSVTYDLGLGTIKRGPNHEKLYEVPGHQWADMTAENGEFGAAVLNDCKYGWDHPEKNVLRLTLIHTPGVFESWAWVGDQSSQDMGRHEFTFAVCGHKGDVSQSDVAWQAARLNQPLLAFQAPKHDGKLGKTCSLLSVSSDDVFVNAVKKSESSDDIVVRVRELSGTGVDNAKITFAKSILSAREINGFEETVGDAVFQGKELTVSLTPYQPKAFAVKLQESDSDLRTKTQFASVSLPFDLDCISGDDNRKDGDIDGHGNCLVAELLPDTVWFRGVPFVIGPTNAGAKNAVSCTGQAIDLPKGEHDILHLLACAVNGPTLGRCTIGAETPVSLLQDYCIPLGQWNNRINSGRFSENPDGIAPAYVNRQPVAWYGSHRHSQGENEAYRFTYLYDVPLKIPQGATSLRLPIKQNIRVFAATVVKSTIDNVTPAQPLYDEAEAAIAIVNVDSVDFAGHATISMTTPNPRANIRYALDGKAPDQGSHHYEMPFAIDSSTTIKAQAILAGIDSSFVTTVTCRKLMPVDAVPTVESEPGLNCTYYEGSWSKLPDFDTVKAVRQFVADQCVLPEFARQEDFGLVFYGFFNAPTEGMYEFIISSDDGSRLYIGDSLLIDNDGLHGSGDMTGHVVLKPGLHPFTLRMFQCKGGRDLNAWVSGPGIVREQLGPTRLSHATTANR
jgi:alpha-mannosidase